MNGRIKSSLPLMGYTAFFALLFLPLAWNGQLPGNIDTLLSVALSNQGLEKIRLLMEGLSTQTALFPAKDVLAYGENCFGLAGMFILFKLITKQDITAYYLFITTIFTLNAFAIHRLLSLFVYQRATAFLSALVFPLSGFILANIDDPNVVFVFFPVMAIYHLFQGSRSGGGRHFLAAVMLSATQIWFGFYVFFYQALVLACFSVMNWRRLRSILSARKIIELALVYAAIISPVFAVYIYNFLYADIASPFGSSHVFEATSLGWHNFSHVLPDNLLYSDASNAYVPSEDSYWARIRKCCFPGLCLPIFALAGLLRAYSTKTTVRRELTFLLLIGAIFLFLAFGANLPTGVKPMALPLIEFFRVPVRFYVFTMLSLTIFFGIGVEWATPKTKMAYTPFLALAFSLFAAENVPYPIKAFEYASVLQPSASYSDFFARFPERQVVLDLPTRALFLPTENFSMGDRIWFYTRDIIYMNWQSYHHQLILGGTNGYLPKSRQDLEPTLLDLANEASVRNLRKVGVKYIVFHKKLVLRPEEAILGSLKNSPSLALKAESEDEAIFEYVY